MSNHARIGMPALIMTGRMGACGKINRTDKLLGKFSSGIIFTKSWPSAPRPWSHITLLVAGWRGLTVMHSNDLLLFILFVLRVLTIAMKKFSFILLLICLIISGCGQTGSLYLPKDPSNSKAKQAGELR